MPRPRHILGHLLTVLAAFAAVVQWSVPHGWMITQGADGNTILAPCPATSPALAALAKSSGAHAHHQHHHNHPQHGDTASAQALHSSHDEGTSSVAEALCDQAAVGAPTLLPAVPEIAERAPASDQVFITRLASTPGRGLAAPPPPSTGPPSLNT